MFARQRASRLPSSSCNRIFRPRLEILEDRLTPSGGSATQLVVVSTPAPPLFSGVGVNLQVAAEDPAGNVDPNFNSLVTVFLANNPGAGSGGAYAQAGLASFTDLKISPGGPTTLEFTATGLTSTTVTLNLLAFQMSLTSEAEDTLSPPSDPIFNLLNHHFGDPDKNTKPGIAVAGLTGNGTWEYAAFNSSAWQKMGTVSPTQARLLPYTDNIRFVPAPGWTGQAELFYYAWDGSQGTVNGSADVTAGGGSTAFSSAEALATLTVTSVNHAPTWDTSSAYLTPIPPGDTDPAGDTVASIFGPIFSDSDGNPVGIAVTGLTAQNSGTWQYMLQDSTTWTPFGSVSAGAAQLLSGSDLIRFVPNPGFLGMASLEAYAWDGTTGTDGKTVDLTAHGATGGSTAFSTTLVTTGFAVNDAPALASTTGPALPAIPENVTSSPVTVATLLSTAGESDPDAGALQGVAIVGATGPGTWQYSLGGKSWQAVGAVSESLARLLVPTAQLRFVPAANQSGPASLIYRAWDQTEGLGGSLFTVNGTGGACTLSSTEAMATLTVTFVHHAPSWLGSDPSLTPVPYAAANPAGDTVASVFGSSFQGTASVGIAIVGLSGARSGSWQYSLDAGASWTAFGSVSTHAALLLSADNLIRFVPQTGFAGTVSLQALAWDGGTGTAGHMLNLSKKGSTGGTTAFSTDRLTAFCLVNTAPTLASSTGPALTSTAEGTASSPVSVTTLLTGAGASDADPTAPMGVAIVGESGAGTWQYSLDGKHWYAVGAVTDSLARLLAGTAQVRFQAAPYQTGQASLGYLAWDEVAGISGALFSVIATGDTSSLSTTAATATLTVTAAHVAPSWSGGSAALTPILPGASNPSGDTVARIFGNNFQSVTGTSVGIAVAGLSGTANGVWQYMLSGGSTWQTIGGASARSALLLSGSDLIRFVPKAGFLGTVSLQAYAWDGSTGTDGASVDLTGRGATGGGTAFSGTLLSATCLVNTAPFLG